MHFYVLSSIGSDIFVKFLIQEQMFSCKMLLYSGINVILTVMESQLWWNFDSVVWLYLMASMYCSGYYYCNGCLSSNTKTHNITWKGCNGMLDYNLRGYLCEFFIVISFLLIKYSSMINLYYA